jgi:hypothetical protein
MSKRRGRERKRQDDSHRHEVLYVGEWMVLVDTQTGDIRHNLDPHLMGRDARDRLTVAVLSILDKWGWVPADPLEIRDVLFLP